MNCFKRYQVFCDTKGKLQYTKYVLSNNTQQAVDQTTNATPADATEAEHQCEMYCVKHCVKTGNNTLNAASMLRLNISCRAITHYCTKEKEQKKIRTHKRKHNIRMNS